MKRAITVILAIALFAAVSTGCSGKGDKPATETAAVTPVKFNIGHLASTGHILYFIAREKGFFKENGLDVELFLFSNSGEGINAIIAEKLDAGSFGTAPPLTFIAKGAELSIFGGQMTEGHAVIATPEKAKQFKNLQGFKGKTVATVRLATGDIVLRSALANAGIDWKKDLTINEMESPAAVLEAVKKGSADAGVVWTPFRKMAEEQGMKIIMYSGDAPGMKNHPCCRQIALAKCIRKNPDNYKRMLAGMLRAYDFYKSNQDESIDILAKYVKVDKEILKAETYGAHIQSSPDPNKEGVIEFWKAMKAADYISSDIDIANYINTELFADALESVLKKYPDNANYKELKETFKL
jgi:NitT/TauT family transport system substrate-binding protein